MKTNSQKQLLGWGSVVAVLACVVLAFTQFGYPEAAKNTKTKGTTTTETTDQAAAEKSAKEKLIAALPDAFSNDDELVLVNNDHEYTKVSDDLNLVLMTSGIYYALDVANTAYNQMAEAASQDGITLVAVYAYRSASMQQTAYDNMLAAYEEEGQTEEEAKVSTGKYLNAPGYSEYQTGLALDIVDADWNAAGTGLVASFGATDAGKWLKSNAATYGFVLRYPEGKESVTGMNYQPWHFRYVGVENAKFMTTNNLTLEEYVALLEEAGK